MSKETMSFQTEVKQLLHLMIHSLYSNRDIFLRELISNASDACDKLRLEALSNEKLFEESAELSITVGFDAKARTVTIADNGIGMSRDEVIANLAPLLDRVPKSSLESSQVTLQKTPPLSVSLGLASTPRLLLLTGLSL